MQLFRQKSKVKGQRFQKGFSLLETLVALAVLTAAVTGPLNLASTSIRSASLSHNRIIASFLAEEAMELVRARRDAAAYGGGDWLADIGECQDQNCLADAFASSAADLIRACVGACPKLKYDPAFGAFQYASGNDSVFTRSVRIAPVGDGTKEISIIVTVKWKERFLPAESEVVIDNSLLNWK